MATRQSNLLVDPSVAPAAGFGPIIQWYGGPINIEFTGNGTYGGASFDVYMTTKLPIDGLAASIAASDWVKLNAAAIAADAVFALDNLNPCLVTVKCTSPAVGTRVRAVCL